MSIKTTVKRMEKRLGLDDENEVVIYEYPNEDGSVDALHVTSQGSWIEVVRKEDFEEWLKNRPLAGP